MDFICQGQGSKGRHNYTISGFASQGHDQPGHVPGILIL